MVNNTLIHGSADVVQHSPECKELIETIMMNHILYYHIGYLIISQLTCLEDFLGITEKY